MAEYEDVKLMKFSELNLNPEILSGLTKMGYVELTEIQESDQFIDFAIEAAYCLEGYGVIDGYIGDALQDRFARWSKHIGG